MRFLLYAQNPYEAVDPLTMFFVKLSVTFVTLQPLSTIVGRRVGVKYWIAIMMLAWGSICMGHAGIRGTGIRGRGTLIALRLLLGAAEAGFVPSVFVSPKLSIRPSFI